MNLASDAGAESAQRIVDPGARPGQRRLLEFLGDELLGPLGLCVALAVQAALGLRTAVDPDQAQVLLFGLPLLAALMVLVGRVLRHWPRARALWQLQRQQQGLAAQLDELAHPSGFAVHGLVGAGLEIDHVLVLPAGVFVISVVVIEPLPGHAPSAQYDGEFLHLDGGLSERDPIARARVVSRNLAERLRQQIGHLPTVRALLCVPGWSLTTLANPRKDLELGRPAELIARLERLPALLESDEIARLRAAMTQVVRDGRRYRESLKHGGSVLR
jgi:hypothetical protein